ncbi:MAG: PEP-CTERM sorting domain-containing protein, partial [Bacteroidaceae bacterium]|nr:PEP-CTERM sorting domain-containing protein [Bacteroidaceae bacterium]
MGATPEPYTSGAVQAWLTKNVIPNATGCAYTLTFKIDEDWNNLTDNQMSFFKLNSSWGIHIQQSKYVGLKNSLEDNLENNTVKGNFASRNGTESNYSIDMDTTYAVDSDGVKQDQYQGWFYEGSSFYTGIAGATFTIASSGNAGFNITFSNNGKTITLQKDGHIEMANIGFLYEKMDLESAVATVNKDGIDSTYTYTPAVPEPTTATLSLLALAGLAARRRRK